MFNCQQFRELIVKPTLSKLQAYSSEAEELLVFTCAAETNGGTYLQQLNGPALGIYQCEPSTYTDIWEKYIRHNSRVLLLLQIHFGCTFLPKCDRLIYDLEFATAMARLHYMRFKDELPKADDINGIYEYYKKFYNTPKGAATKTESIKKYKAFTTL